MKRAISLITLCLALVFQAIAQMSENESFDAWKNDKYSMFIHFGLYSYLGGEWEGEPVRRGYSEQIQSFGGIFGDWYASVADEFDPVCFDAAEIASLAKKAGMRSVVFTSKHHDGFCMFDTKTTEYNSVDLTPSKRDYVRELSDACAREGLKFGLYFSLIDWNYPQASPISSHNADFVTPDHHELNMAQVRELLTGYGPVSELWFDMGSLRPEQSRELYALVKELQPDCMVSGRLGNDVYDFAVMADNKLPEVALHAPWQSAASMFSETWSYRSWQERGEVQDKVAEKLRSLIDVVSRGGNYLLNIGPSGDGNVVPFEKDVLLGIGSWLDGNGYAIYGTEASPFREIYDWGAVTYRGNEIYLLLTGDMPQSGSAVLPMPAGYSLKDVRGASARMSRRGECVVQLNEDMYADPADVHVVTLVFDKEVRPVPMNSGVWADYSYSCFDYYSNYRSSVAYNHAMAFRGSVKEIELVYAKSDIGRKVHVQVGDYECDVTLDGSCAEELEGVTELYGYEFGRMRGGTFDRSLSVSGVEWSKADTDCFKYDTRPFANHLLAAAMKSEMPAWVVLEVTSGNGAEMAVVGEDPDENRSLFKHLNPYGTKSLTEQVLVEVPAGETHLVMRSYNRFEREGAIGLVLAEEQRLYRQKILVPASDRPKAVGGRIVVRLSAADAVSPHADCGLHNLRVFVK